MSIDAGIVPDALMFVEKKTLQLTTMQKIDEKIKAMNEEETENH